MAPRQESQHVSGTIPRTSANRTSPALICKNLSHVQQRNDLADSGARGSPTRLILLALSPGIARLLPVQGDRLAADQAFGNPFARLVVDGVWRFQCLADGFAEPRLVGGREITAAAFSTFPRNRVSLQATLFTLPRRSRSLQTDGPDRLGHQLLAFARGPGAETPDGNGAVPSDARKGIPDPSIQTIEEPEADLAFRVLRR